ncbi:hypothetical protein DKM44_00355 [Deinococcus irradiatisoli]|uniref:Uncharacterized protein n=1 Tax=Deinococcus irradiatisoli TaxID=2202254 RepID=A0A2Z3J9U0_9DEIO|nr:hypothetical protein [Deinococcus irradiatisoli]AWN21877.1 hypothetical protein DKM44_00355 [Deinococcus irradiatisoli]
MLSRTPSISQPLAPLSSARAEGRQLAAPTWLLGALPYLGLSLIFLALPLGLVLLGVASWTTVLLLAAMNLAVVGWVALENQREERLIESP